MNLGVFLPPGESVRKMRKIGQDVRFMNLYLKKYAKHFDNVLVFSYENEEVELPRKCALIKNWSGLPRHFYALLMPVVEGKHIKKCDVSRVMQVTGTIPTVISKILHGKPYVTTCGYRYSEFARIEKGRFVAALVWIVERLGLRFADGVIVTTKDLENHVSKYVSKSKIFLIPNGVDIKKFKPSKEKKKSKEKVIMFVGRLEKQKNLFSLIDAVAILSKSYPVKLALIGSGSLIDKLKQYSDEKKIKVEFVGVVVHEDLPLYLNQADVFVLPSLVEGHPKTLLEAMACGLPCVGTNVRGTKEVIKDEENGLLCETNPEDIAEKIKYVFDNPRKSKRMGANASRYIKDNFSIDELLQKEVEVLKTITE